MMRKFTSDMIYLTSLFYPNTMVLLNLNSAMDPCLFCICMMRCVIFRFYNNAYYARVGGVTTKELNKLEMKFLFGLDFQLHVSVQTFRSYCSLLEKEGTVGLQIERSIQACRISQNWSNKDDSTCAQLQDELLQW